MKRNLLANHRGADVCPNGHGTDTLPILLAQPQVTELDLPPLSAVDQAALASFMERQQVLKDLTVGCITGHHTGAFIHGPPGTSKSYSVEETLLEHKASCRVHQRITAKPLYLQLEKYPDAVHVIDDCEQLFSEKAALTLLRSALGSGRVDGHRERRVSFSVTGYRARVLEHFFYGTLIFIGNRALAEEIPEIRAVMSRVPHLSFTPPDREI